MPLQQTTWQHSKAAGNLAGVNVGVSWSSDGPCSGTARVAKPHWAAEPLPKHSVSSQPAAPKLLSVSTWVQTSTCG